MEIVAQSYSGSFQSKIEIISLSSDVCPLCSVEEDTVEHLFHSCTVVSEVWKWFFKWCKLSMEQHTSLDHLISSLINHDTSDKGKKFMETTVGCVPWFVWKARNNVVFNNTRRRW
ncbi:hypothetical protein OSB04_020506 [Centaurea solstitialis]|uniref:Reverse transcriptase zinc-binding domain-containing protein n=1 Tax=Centaurea solstitialis TaxID=347529 RepID=A0AA38SST5_9ASTR|nr:hypothetical protein OSB04_020506 [Centaurea solstitialis]